MRTTTITGKRMTTPRGTDMLELPFNLSGRLKKANFDVNLLAFPLRPFSSEGSWGVGVGAICDTRRRRSMMEVDACDRRDETCRNAQCAKEMEKLLVRVGFPSLERGGQMGDGWRVDRPSLFGWEEN